MATVQQASYKTKEAEDSQNKVEEARRMQEISRKIELYGKSFKQVLARKNAVEESFTNLVKNVENNQSMHMVRQQQDSAKRHTFEEVSAKSDQYQQTNNLEKSSQLQVINQKNIQEAVVSINEKLTQAIKQQVSQQNAPLPLQAQIFVATLPVDPNLNVHKLKSDPRLLQAVTKKDVNKISNHSARAVDTSNVKGSTQSKANISLIDAGQESQDMGDMPKGLPQTETVHRGQHIQQEKVMALQTAFDAFKKQLNMKYPSLRVPAIHPHLGSFEVNMRYDRNTGAVKQVQFICKNEGMTELLANNRKGFERILANYGMADKDTNSFSFLTQAKLEDI